MTDTANTATDYPFTLCCRCARPGCTPAEPYLICADLARPDSPRRLGRLSLYGHSVADVDTFGPAGFLAYLAGMADEVDTLQSNTAHRMRKAGASWAQIGAALGVSRQAAAKRFG